MQKQELITSESARIAHTEIKSQVSSPEQFQNDLEEIKILRKEVDRLCSQQIEHIQTQRQVATQSSHRLRTSIYQMALTCIVFVVACCLGGSVPAGSPRPWKRSTVLMFRLLFTIFFISSLVWLLVNKFEGRRIHAPATLGAFTGFFLFADLLVELCQCCTHGNLDSAQRVTETLQHQIHQDLTAITVAHAQSAQNYSLGNPPEEFMFLTTSSQPVKRNDNNNEAASLDSSVVVLHQ